MKKDVIILTAINPTKAYSCVKYLYDNISPKYAVELWALVSSDSIEQYRTWGETVHSFSSNPFGKIPKVRMIAMKIIGFFLCLSYRNRTIICHETYHYHSACFVKILFPKTKLIHYCTEMYNEKSARFQQRQLKYYRRHANDPDLIIECNAERKEYRKELYGIIKPQVVIENTIPSSELSDYSNIKYGLNDVPTIVYSGGCHNVHELDIIVNALKLLDFDFVAKFIVYGPTDAIEVLKEQCKTISNAKIEIVTGLTRDKALAHVANSDIGVVYYDPDYSVNCRYAAPTKFFEYIGLGVPLVSSKNDSLVRIIEDYKVGEYLETNDAEGMAKAISRLANKTYRESVHLNEIKAFSEHLSYESQATNAYEHIYSVLGENR